MTNFVTLMHLLTPLHTGGSADEGNLMGIAREVHTEFPYLPASSLRGKIRAQMTSICGDKAEIFFGQKIKDGQQPTEGEVWFADSTLLFFPVASLSHHLVWITCPLWLERWNRWLDGTPLNSVIEDCRTQLRKTSAVVSFDSEVIYLQTAILNADDFDELDITSFSKITEPLTIANSTISQLINKLVVLNDEDCIALVETGLQREVKVALNENEKTLTYSPL
jgi:CRISPR-associated protein Cmr4